NIVSQVLADSIVPSIEWTIPTSYIGKNTMIVLDIMAHDDWNRPICFTTTAGSEAYIGLEKYLQLKGLVYQLVPIKNDMYSEKKNIADDVMYDNVVHKFRWGNMGSGVYIDENARNMAYQLRDKVSQLAERLIEENKRDSALRILNLCIDSIPDKTYTYDEPVALMVECYYELGNADKANEISRHMFDEGESRLRYFSKLDNDSRLYYWYYEGVKTKSILYELTLMAKDFRQENIYTRYQSRIDGMLKDSVINKQ